MLLNTKEKFIAAILITILAACIVTCGKLAFGQSPPIAYYTFDNVNPLAPTIGTTNIATSGTYAIGNNGLVGRFIDLTNANNQIQAGSYNIGGSNAFTVQMLFKFQHNTMFGAFQPMFSYQNIDASFEFPSIGFKGFFIKLDGINRKSWQYYLDNQWHHAAFVYNKVSGIKKIYIDGLLAGGFQGSQGVGTPFPSATHPLYITPFTLQERIYHGYIDEYAFYNVELSASQIYKNYREALLGQHYTATLWPSPIPTAPATSANVDPLNYAPGYPSVTSSVVEQLTTYPTPRYNPLRPLKRNMSWFDMAYMLYNSGSYNFLMTTGQRNNLRATQSELATNYNFYLSASENSTVNVDGKTWDTTSFRGQLIKICNDRPQFPCAIKTFWAQVSTGKIQSQNNPINHYARNNSGLFIGLTGSPSGTKYRSNAAPNDSIVKDANTQSRYIDTLLTYLTRPIDLWNENGEVIHRFLDAGITNDVAALTERNVSYPAFTLQQYQGKKFTISTNVYKNPSIIKPALAATKFTSYAIDGQNEYRINYQFAREQMSIIDGRYYSTPDFYPRWADNWIAWSTAWHGWEWIVASRKNELALNDTFYSPYVAHGWDVPETGNISPPQWLALMKTLVASGAEWFYPSTFSGATLPGNQYCWALIFPSYAQALTSKISWYRQSYLLTGDMPRNFIGNTNDPGYAFYTGDRNVLVVIRKHTSLPKYLISAAVLPLSNQQGQVPNSKDVLLKGFNNIVIRALRQGAMYELDSTQAPPLFRQLDGWHESKHPSYWSSNYVFEGELSDTGGVYKTYNQVGSDFTNYTTVVGLTATDTAKYYFDVRQGATYNIAVKARTVASPSGFDVSIDGTDVGQLPCVTSTSYCWYKYDDCINSTPMTVSLTAGRHVLQIVSYNNDIEVDSIYISAGSLSVLADCSIPCNGISTAITPSGTVNICDGNSQVFIANPGASFLWSTGATTQSITASVSATYTVTVTDGNACTATASVILIVAPAVVPTVTPSGATTFCAGNSVTLTSSAAAIYNWSNGATTQSITASTSATYIVTVSSNGCTSTSAPTVVTVNNLPVASIAKMPLTPVCIPATVTLTASGGTSYLWSTGTTTALLVATQQGTYTVIVVDANGCTKSAASNVVMNTPSAAFVSPAGTTTICVGDTATLTATQGTAYLWSNGATTQSIRVTTYGQYAAYVTDADGCQSTTNTILVDTVSQSAIVATITPIIGINCDSFIIQANIADAYLWNTGATTQDIRANTSNTYTVTVTNSLSGCSKSVNYKYNGEISLLLPPTQLTNVEVGANYARIAFAPTSGASFFRVEICDAEKVRLNWVTLLYSETNLYYIRLQPNKRYYWRVRAFCENPVRHRSAFSDYLELRTKIR